jgi:hypothetical protein
MNYIDKLRSLRSDDGHLAILAWEIYPALVEVVAASESALVEMQRLLTDYHAPSYMGTDLVRQLEPLLCQALAALRAKVGE